MALPFFPSDELFTQARSLAERLFTDTCSIARRTVDPRTQLPRKAAVVIASNIPCTVELPSEPPNVAQTISLSDTTTISEDMERTIDMPLFTDVREDDEITVTNHLSLVQTLYKVKATTADMSFNLTLSIRAEKVEQL